MSIRFQHLPLELEHRVKTALQALREGNLTDIQAASFFFRYFFQRLEPMYRDNPVAVKTIPAVVKSQEVGLVVPKLVDVTLQITTISDLKFSKGVGIKSPSMIFEDLQTVEDILLARTTLPQALVDKKIKVKKLASILKWLAPIATLQSEETLQQIREEDLNILAQNLQEIGY